MVSSTAKHSKAAKRRQACACRPERASLRTGFNNNNNQHYNLMMIPVHSPCLGLDVAKAKLDACLLLGGHKHHATFENSRPGMRKLLAWVRKLHPDPLSRAVMEATGPYGELAAASLHKAGHRVSVINPRWIKDHARSLGRRNKTDRLDAQLIADYARTHDCDQWLPQAPELAILKGLLRRLASVDSMIQAEQRRDECALSKEPLLLQSLRRVKRALTAEQKHLEKAIASHLRAHPLLREECTLLQQIEGIGPKAARWLCAELPRHLHSSRAAAAWVGVTPCKHESGSSLRDPSTIGREGNRHLRRVLYMPAVVARQKNPRLKAFADRLEANGKSKMVVLFAILHKLVRTAFAILKNHSHYDPLHFPLPAHNRPS
jgi:transposase